MMPAPALAQTIQTPNRFPEANLELLGGELLPATDDTLAVDGIRGILRTTWRSTGPVPSGTWVEIDAELVGERLARMADLPATWWYPPEQWSTGERVRIDVSVPLRGLTGWSARVFTPS
jgi:hypothetical protein